MKMFFKGYKLPLYFAFFFKYNSRAVSGVAVPVKDFIGANSSQALTSSNVNLSKNLKESKMEKQELPSFLHHL